MGCMDVRGEVSGPFGCVKKPRPAAFRERRVQLHSGSSRIADEDEFLPQRLAFALEFEDKQSFLVRIDSREECEPSFITSVRWTTEREHRFLFREWHAFSWIWMLEQKLER